MTLAISPWHAICIYGFNPVTGVFMFKNSWGDDWGKGGYGTITADYISRFASEAWIGWGAKKIPPRLMPPAPISPVLAARAPLAVRAPLSARPSSVGAGNIRIPLAAYNKKYLRDFLKYLNRTKTYEEIAAVLQGSKEPHSLSTIGRIIRNETNADYPQNWQLLQKKFRKEFIAWNNS